MATENELAQVRARLFGLISEDRITAIEIERPSPDVLAGLGRVTDLTSSVSDVLDERGVGGGVPGSTLRPLSAGQRVIGPAITIRYVPEGGSVGSLSGRGERARLADRDLYNVGQAGDVAVFDCGGFTGASVMGGLSAAWASRLEIAGCVIDGAARDVAAIRASGVPVWSRGVTPVSGKHRLEAIEINGVVGLTGVTVRPGDVIVADDTGVCVIPAEHAEAVTRAALEAEAAERTLTDAIASGASPEEVAAILRPEKW
jgi:4-hydroxy-4-methyl-2-oxoglutarate aldolase